MHACDRDALASHGCVHLNRAFASAAPRQAALRASMDGLLLLVCSIPIGLLALGSHPMKPGKGPVGQRDVPVVVGGVAISPG